MSQTAQHTRSIVVGFDLSPLGELAVREAAALAGSSDRSTIHIVTVVEDLQKAASPPSGLIQGMRSRVAAALRAHATNTDVLIVAHLCAGDPASEILSLAEDVEATNIIIGTHGRHGVKQLVVGSVAEAIVRRARCPVTVMRPCRYEAHPELRPEPPCPVCLAARRESRGVRRWCDAHAGPWVPPHRYSYTDGGFHPFHADGLGPT